MRYVQIRVINTTGQRVIHDLRTAVFRHITTRSLRFFDKSPVGRLVTRTTHDVETLNDLFVSGIDVIFYDLLRLVVIIAVLFAVDWRMALAALGVIPLIAVHAFWFQRQARRLFRSVREKITALNTFLNESITGIRIVQAFRREKAIRKRVRVEEPGAPGRAPRDRRELQPLLPRHGVPLRRRNGADRLVRQRALLRRADRPRRSRDVLDVVQHLHRAAEAARGQVQRACNRRSRRPSASSRSSTTTARCRSRPIPSPSAR